MSVRYNIYADPKCRFCLGTGRSQSIIRDITPICRCVTGQLRIHTVKPDYSIPGDERHDPPQDEFMEVQE